MHALYKGLGSFVNSPESTWEIAVLLTDVALMLIDPNLYASISCMNSATTPFIGVSSLTK